jgi:hypothetical protein
MDKQRLGQTHIQFEKDSRGEADSNRRDVDGPTQEADSSSEESLEERMRRAGEDTRIIAKSRTESSLVKNAQELIIDIVNSKGWQRFFTSFDELVEHEIFESWVTTMMPRGLGMTIEDLKLIASGNKKCLDAIDDETQRKAGALRGNKSAVKKTIDNNVIDCFDSQETIKAPQGNSKRKALRKLRTESKKNPKVEALYQQVLADKISCHAAMLQAGFRRPSKTYIGTPIERAIKALKDCSAKELDIIAEELSRLRKGADA